MEGNVKNIIVIGEVGSGKSSIINLILGENTTAVSKGVERCTSDITKYGYKTFLIFDTIGFNDIRDRTPTNSLSLANLLEKEPGGISLIIFVMKKGRINSIAKKNYDYFVNYICSGKVPVLLVVTHCEGYSERSNWYLTEEKMFREMGMSFADVVCGCAADISSPYFDSELIPNLKKKRNITQQEIREKVERLALKEGFRPRSRNTWFIKLLFGGIGIGWAIYMISRYFWTKPSVEILHQQDAIEPVRAQITAKFQNYWDDFIEYFFDKYEHLWI